MPRAELPSIRISEEREQAIARWLYDEIEGTLKARQPIEDLWLEIQEFYEKTELEEKRDWPFEGAANLMIPLMPMFVEQIKAKIFNTIFAPRDIFAVRPFNKVFKDHVKPLRNFITWAAQEELFLRRHCRGVFLEYLKLGNAVNKTIYEEETRSEIVWDEDLEDFVETIVTVADHPRFVHVPLADFLFPLEATSEEDMYWKAHRIRLRWPDLVRRQQQGVYENIEEIKNWTEHQRTDYDEQRQDQADFEPYDLQEYEIWEVWFEQTLEEGDGEAGTAEPEDQNPRHVARRMVWWIHLDSRVVLRKVYNWFPLQLDPFDVLGFDICRAPAGALQIS